MKKLVKALLGLIRPCPIKGSAQVLFQFESAKNRLKVLNQKALDEQVELSKQIEALSIRNNELRASRNSNEVVIRNISSLLNK